MDELTDNETSGRGGEASTCLKMKGKILDNSGHVMVKEVTSSGPLCRSWFARHTPLLMAKIESLGIGTPWNPISNHEQLENSTTELQRHTCLFLTMLQRKSVRYLLLGVRSMGIDWEIQLVIFSLASQECISISFA